MENNRVIRLDYIQFLRGIAAIMVVYDHTIWFSYLKDGQHKELFLWSEVMGRYAVELFFEISGFIMIYTSIGQFGENGSPIKFMERRIIRIVPMYWLIGLIPMAKSMLMKRHIPILYILSSYLFIPYFNGKEIESPVIGVGWTLIYEMLFYIIFAIGLNFRMIVGISVIFVSISLLIIFGPTELLKLDYVSIPQILKVYTDKIMAYFLIGMAIGYIFRIFDGKYKKISVGLPLMAAFSAIIAAVVLIYSFVNNDNIQDTPLQVAGLTISLLIFIGFSDRSDGSRFQRLFRRLSSAAGAASYSIYLTHTLIIIPFQNVFPNRIPYSIYVFGSLLFCSLIGYALYRFVETPLIVKLRGMLKARPYRPKTLQEV